MKTRKSRTVGSHLNDDEYTLIKARAEAAAARSLGAYIKAAVFDKPVPEQRVDGISKMEHPMITSGSLSRLCCISQSVYHSTQSRHEGYRVYFVERGLEIIVLLCGGDKSSQQKDIEKAKVLAKEL